MKEFLTAATECNSATVSVINQTAVANLGVKSGVLHGCHTRFLVILRASRLHENIVGLIQLGYAPLYILSSKDFIYSSHYKKKRNISITVEKNNVSINLNINTKLTYCITRITTLSFLLIVCEFFKTTS